MSIRTISIAAAVSMMAACSTVPETSTKPWVTLFDGESFNGWRVENGDDPFEIINGEIVGKTVSGVPTRYLTTEDSYGDFIFEAEMNNSEGDNSGIQFRSQIGTSFYSGLNGYQLEVDPSERRWTGGIYTEGLAVWKHPMIENDACRNAWNYDGWNKLRIETSGDLLRTFVNDIACAKVYDETLSEGHFGLQIHSVGKNPGRAGKPTKWRNIRIKENPPQSDYSSDNFEMGSESYLWDKLSPYETDNDWSLVDNSTTKNAMWAKADRKNLITESTREISVLKLESQRETNAAISLPNSSFHAIIDFQLDEGSAGEILYPVSFQDENGKVVSCMASYRIFDDKSVEKRDKGDPQLMGALRGKIAAKNLDEEGRNKRVFSKDAWRRAEIRVVDDGVEHWLNSIRVVKYKLNECSNSNAGEFDKGQSLIFNLETGSMNIGMIKTKSLAN